MSNIIECQVVIPPNVPPGETLLIQVEQNRENYSVIVPPNAQPGQTIKIQIPVITPNPPNTLSSSCRQQNEPQPLWSGTFLKLSSGFIRAYLLRHGAIQPRKEDPNSFEIAYFAEGDMHNGRKKRSIPIGWSPSRPEFKGRLCFKDMPTSRRTPFYLETIDRVYELQFGENITDTAAFYLCYRVCACGDNREMAKTAIFGKSELEPIEQAMQLLYTEQKRLEDKGINRFDAANALIYTAGNGDAALASIIAGVVQTPG